MIDSLLADDEICRMFDVEWKAFDWTRVQFSAPPLIVYEGLESDIKPDITSSYCRVTINPADSIQATLSDRPKFANYGLISVQSFAPVSKGNALEVAKYMAIIAQRIYQGKRSPNGMWFRNCRTNRIGASGGWYQFNTLIEYQYDEKR